MTHPTPLAPPVRAALALAWLLGCSGGEAGSALSPAGSAATNANADATVSAEVASPSASASVAAAPICDGEACWTLGGKEKDPQRSEAYYREGCNQEHPRSCDFLAQMLDDPSCGRPFCLNDDGVAVARRGCRLGAKSSCLYLAETLKDKADKAEIEQLYTMGCDDASAIIQDYACRGAADLALARGDLPKAAALAEKRCQNDTPPKGDQPVIEGAKGGCSLYGFLLATGQGVKQDERKGRELLRLMCSLDEEAACEFLKQLERDRR